MRLVILFIFIIAIVYCGLSQFLFIFTLQLIAFLFLFQRKKTIHTLIKFSNLLIKKFQFLTKSINYGKSTKTERPCCRDKKD